MDGTKISWGEVLNLGKQLGYEYPFEAGLWYPNGAITTNRYVHATRVFFYHWVPAYLIDFLMLCFGQKRL